MCVLNGLCILSMCVLKLKGSCRFKHCKYVCIQRFKHMKYVLELLLIVAVFTSLLDLTGKWVSHMWLFTFLSFCCDFEERVMKDWLSLCHGVCSLSGFLSTWGLTVVCRFPSM